MEKKTDVRCYVSPELKKTIKLCAFEKNISVNRFLLNLIKKEICVDYEPFDETKKLNEELNSILSKLGNSADMPVSEREQLKKRKKEIKLLLQK